MSQITVQNHFVPQAYLRNWSLDEKRVWVHSLLVPHSNFPEWQERHIRSLGAHEHLYTSIRDGEESDAFEKWIKSEVEDPASEALRKVAADRPLSRTELHSLVRYAAALDKRTPTSFVEQKQRWESWFPEVMGRTLSKIPTRLARVKKKKSGSSPTPLSDAAPLPFPLPMKVLVGDTPGDNGLIEVRVEVSSGREMWLHSLHHTLTTSYKALLAHNWSIFRPHPGHEWFTSDHPVVRLAYNGPDDYHFDGGWGRRGAEFMLPLTPNHLLYTKIGYSFPPDGQVNAELTLWTQRFIAERATRAIYARQPIRRVSWFRKRNVDADLYKEEQRVWEQFNALQSDAD